MKEGKLSSALQERYGITKENAVGKVLWHSLNENGHIHTYDMKFGDTIIRNLSPEDVLSEASDLHEHGVQEANDPKRKNKK